MHYFDEHEMFARYSQDVRYNILLLQAHKLSEPSFLNLITGIKNKLSKCSTDPVETNPVAAVSLVILDNIDAQTVLKNNGSALVYIYELSRFSEIKLHRF